MHNEFVFLWHVKLDAYLALCGVVSLLLSAARTSASCHTLVIDGLSLVAASYALRIILSIPSRFSAFGCSFAICCSRLMFSVPPYNCAFNRTRNNARALFSHLAPRRLRRRWASKQPADVRKFPTRPRRAQVLQLRLSALCATVQFLSALAPRRSWRASPSQARRKAQIPVGGEILPPFSSVTVVVCSVTMRSWDIA